jgi:PKD repeat protein
VTFDATFSRLNGVSCGSSCSYSWDFGDGSTATGLAVQHTFASSGVFNVTLTVTALATGTSNSITKPVVIAAPSLPVALFAVAPASPTRGVVANFNASPSSVGAGATIASYFWDFGDTTTGTGVTIAHTYSVALPAGDVNVRLTVTDSLGRQASVTRLITLQ